MLVAMKYRTQHFFKQWLQVNTDVYLEVLEELVVLWMRQVANGCYFTFQQNGAPAHNSKKVQDFLSANVPEFLSKEFWPPSSPDANPLNYNVWSVCERGVNKLPQSNIEAVKVTIKRIMMSLNKEHLIKTFSKFRSRIEEIIERNGDFSWTIY